MCDHEAGYASSRPQVRHRAPDPIQGVDERTRVFDHLGDLTIPEKSEPLTLFEYCEDVWVEHMHSVSRRRSGTVRTYGITSENNSSPTG